MFKNFRWLLFFNIVFIMLTPLAFELADKQRGYDSTGGEILFPFIPFVVWLVIKSINELFEELKRND